MNRPARLAVGLVALAVLVIAFIDLLVREVLPGPLDSLVIAVSGTVIYLVSRRGNSIGHRSRP